MCLGGMPAQVVLDGRLGDVHQPVFAFASEEFAASD
jgi:hypothetical protein